MQIDVSGRTVYAGTGGVPFDPALPTVVFVHGVAMDHTAWALQARWFAHHGRGVLAVDLPGCGRSAGPMPTTVATLADWLIGVLDAAGVGQAALVGHSLGALVCLEAAARHPDRAWALGLLGVAVPMPVHPDLLSLSARNDHAAVELMNDWAHSRRSHIGGHRMPGHWLIGSDIRLIERAAPGVLHSGFRACNEYSAEAGRAAATSIRCPVLLLLGERDLMTPARHGRSLAALFPSAEVVVLPDCGHMMMGERPDETLNALRDLV